MALFPIKNPLLADLKRARTRAESQILPSEPPEDRLAARVRTPAESDIFGATVTDEDKAQAFIARQGFAPESTGIPPLDVEPLRDGTASGVQAVPGRVLDVFGTATRAVGRTIKTTAEAVGDIPTPTGGTTPEGRRAATAEVQEAFGFDSTAPGPREPQEFGDDVKGLGLGLLNVGASFAEPVIEPLDVLAETAFSLAKLEKPKGYTEALEDFRDRSIIVQMALGLAFDPAIVLGALAITSRASRGVIAVAIRAELQKSLPDASKSILDSAVEIATDRMSRALANERGGSLPKVEATRPVGPAGLPPLRKADRLKQLEEFGLVVDSSVNDFAAPLRDFDDVLAEVVTREGAPGRALGIAVGPSVSRTSEVGKIATAAQRQKISVEELVSTAMAASFDSHLRQFGNVLPIDPKTGFWKGTNKPWQRIFEAPDEFTQHVSPEARALIDDVNQMTNDEAKRLLEDAGITPRLRDRPGDEYYVPRNVEEIRGIETRRGSDPNLQLHYDDITEGLDAGVVYGKDPRQDIELYMRWVYRQVAKKQLDDVLVDSSVTRAQLLPESVVTRLTEATSTRTTLTLTRRRLRRSIVAAEGQLRTALEKVRGRVRALTTTRADIDNLDEVIDNLALLPFEDAPVVPIRTGVEKVRTSQLGRVAQAEKNLLRVKAREAAQKSRTMTAKQAAEGIEVRLEFLKAQVDNLDGQLDVANTEFRLAKTERRRLMEEFKRATIAPGALWGPNQPLEIPVKEWHSRFFPLEDAELLEQALGAASEPGKLTQAFQTVANSRRFLSAVGDFAMPFIQGLPVLATNPVAWGRMSARHYQAFFDPGVQSRLIRDNITDYQWLAQHGVPIGDPEFFAALQPGQGFSASALFKLLPKGDEVQRLARAGGKQTFGRFQASYNTGLGWARVQLLQAMQKGWKGTDAELAQYIRNLTGGLDSRALGVGPSRRAAEGMWLAFSPRLLRSTIALTADALNPTTQVGRRSLRSLAVLASGATTTYVMTGLALGKDWEEITAGLNPLNGKRFLSHQINGDWIGVGGQIRAITQMIAGITVDPTNLTETSRRDNPILNFLSSRGAPGLQIVAQAGEAAVSELGVGDVDLDPFEQVDGAPDFFKLLGQESLPFTLQGVLEGEQGLTTALALQGLRTSPETPFDRLNEARDEAKKQLGITKDDDALDTLDKRAIDALIPQDIKDEASKARTELGSATEKLKLALREVDDDIDVNIESIATLGPSKAFRDKLSGLNKSRADRKDQERQGDQHAEALEFFEERETSEAIRDRALDSYFAAVTDERLESDLGDFNFALREELLEEVRSEFGDEVFNEIEAFVHEREHPLAAELRTDRETLKPYWEIKEFIASTLNPVSARIYRQFLRSDPTEQANGRLLFSKVINDAEQKVAKAQEAFRELRPEINRLLIKWEYSVSNKFRLLEVQ